MRCQSLVVLVFCQCLVFDQLGMDGLFPVGLPNSLGLCKTGAAILGRICPCGREKPLIKGFVVRFGKLHIGSSVCVVVRLEVRRDGLLDLEVGLANPRRVIGALINRRRASEEDGQDRVPSQESVMNNKSARLLVETWHAGSIAGRDYSTWPKH